MKTGIVFLLQAFFLANISPKYCSTSHVFLPVPGTPYTRSDLSWALPENWNEFRRKKIRSSTYFIVAKDSHPHSKKAVTFIIRSKWKIVSSFKVILHTVCKNRHVCPERCATLWNSLLDILRWETCEKGLRFETCWTWSIIGKLGDI